MKMTLTFDLVLYIELFIRVLSKTTSAITVINITDVHRNSTTKKCNFHQNTDKDLQMIITPNCYRGTTITGLIYVSTLCSKLYY